MLKGIKEKRQTGGLPGMGDFGSGMFGFPGGGSQGMFSS